MSIIVGVMMGAGFASGQEVWQFFGEGSELAIVLFMFIFTFSCFVVLSISYEEKTDHFLPILRKLVGMKLAQFYDVLIVFYLFATTVVMTAGGAAVLAHFNVPYWLAIMIFLLLLTLQLFWGFKGLIIVNFYIFPVLILGLIMTLILFMKQLEEPFILQWGAKQNLLSAFTFTAFNILPIIGVLGAIGKKLHTKGEAVIASIGSGLILGIICIIYNQSLIRIPVDVNDWEIPLYAILDYFPMIIIIMMSLFLFTAIYTTAASGIFGLSARLRERFRIPIWLFLILIFILIIPLTTFGFSALVSVLYPLAGFINLLLLMSILIYPLRVIVNKRMKIEMSSNDR
ncbi:hypothetical protein V1503_20750 [Bacillus sp. SCS-151]|uniref:hypothetical protein n=1 Tax=Nanhaiella sioensis TaxID=3115293 RepID=UPI00397C3474